MSKPRPHREPPHIDPFRDPDERHWSLWLTRSALVLAAAVVFARSTTLETLRNPLDVLPGAAAVPRGTGPAEGLWLDLLAIVPALLVLLRRVVDPTYALRRTWSGVPMLALGAWAFASTLWADDKFAALVSSFHLLAALVLLWSMGQLVTSWLRLRLVSAACFGLLLVMVAQGGYYRFVELPDLRAEWKRNGDQILNERGWQPGSFEADQFEKRVLGGELMGFTSSPNSFAAVLVLLSVVTGGLLAQRLARRDELRTDVAKGATLPVIGLAVALPLAAAVLWITHSRTGAAMALAGAAGLGLITFVRPVLGGFARPLYFAGIAAAMLAAAAIVIVGIKTGGLVHVSLTFRWRYWVGGAGAFLAHPLFGVGYENFGLHYLGHRLAIAAEEVRDPHNFVVRFFVELGGVGGLLLVAWQLRLWWELTRPAAPREPKATDAPVSAVAAATTVGLIGLVLSLLASVDFTQSGAFVGLELMRRGGFFALFVLGMTVGLVRSVESSTADERPASWLLYACVLATGLFLVHNLVDFSFFEAGPMLLFAMVAGAALGVRTAANESAPSSRRAVVVGAFAVGAMLWIIAALGLALPVTLAEADAAQGDDAVRQNNAPSAAACFTRATERVPYNADYWLRTAQATYGYGGNGKPLVERALAAQPTSIKAMLFRARAEAASPSPDWPRVVVDYRRALELDPYNVPIRLELADVLVRSGDPEAARVQFEETLRIDDLLLPDETKRMKPDQIATVRARLDKLGKP